MNKKITADYDNGWKEVLEEYFKEFLLFYFPHIHPEFSSQKIKLLTFNRL